MNDVILKADENAIQVKATRALIESSYVINKGYLAELKDYQVQPVADASQLNINADVRLYKIERVVLDNQQSVLESLTAAYTALGAAGFTLFFYIECNGIETSLYIGVRGEPNKIQGFSAGRLLTEAFQGHFSGSYLEEIEGKKVANFLNDIDLSTNGGASNASTVTAVSGVPSLAVEEREHFMQGIERFIDAAEGRKYRALILAEPVSKQNLDIVKLGYEQIATQLSPLLKQSLSYGENQSDAVSEALGYSLSESLGKSVSLTESIGKTKTKSYSKTIGASCSKTKSFARSNKAIAFLPTYMRIPLTLAGVGESKSESTTESYNSSETESYSTAYSQTKSTGTTETSNTTKGENTTKTDTFTHGSSKTLSIETTDKGIEQLLNKIDHHLERVEEANRYGAWNTAAYFIGEDVASSESLASIFLGLMRGQNSNTENFALTTWDASNDEKPGVIRWLKNLSHPRLKIESLSSFDIDYLTPATLVSGQEIAVQLSIPRRSTSGTAVIQTQAFGRRIQHLDLDNTGKNANQIKKIDLGVIRHLWEERKQRVQLDINNLTSHLFVTGSTGSGKSNTVYEILSQLNRLDIPFMIIEPAKGEYKHVFGNVSGVSVYGTNPKLSELLRINPFAFPKSIHVLEHIDRLIEIFNVCWPMYAAMPAILKEAILEAYIQCGWDLDDSTNLFQQTVFPTFLDVLHSLECVIQESSFSQEVKSNYTGSLVTRIKSLTNGLNGQIFTSNEIRSSKLFNTNCIVDLSRVGSSETKSLIMGILLIRLNEFRMDEGGMNLPLRHITVLEEAHNILKATASSGQEGANLEHKSVEMLTNSIAEMRTYGEGFIIVDQSPGAVDISAIRNTNTKIIMRLPEEVDRRSAGKSIGLKDEQLDEISKFPRGVALINQNDWLEPVLCKINQFEPNSSEKIFRYTPYYKEKVTIQAFRGTVLQMLLGNMTENRREIIIEGHITQGIAGFSLSGRVRGYLLQALSEHQSNKIPSLVTKGFERELSNLLIEVLGLKKRVIKELTDQDLKREIKEAVKSIDNALLEQCIGSIRYEYDR